MKQFYRDPATIAASLEKWLKESFLLANAKGGAFGLSGGVDSAALAALLRRVCPRDSMLALIMPCHSLPIDEEHARLVANALDIPVAKIDLTETYDRLLAAMGPGAGELSPLAAANIKPRLRMTTLYAAAQSRNLLVCGGSNMAELMFGYFTKHGDSGVDLMPFGGLLKGEVFALARYLGVPDAIIDKPPTAGLWEGQTDEAEMGVTYADLDRFLAIGMGKSAVCKRIHQAEDASQHKRAMPQIAPLPGQDFICDPPFAEEDEPDPSDLSDEDL